MRKFKGYVHTDVIQSECEFDFETEDNATAEEIEKAGHDALWESGLVEWWFEEA